MYQLKNIQLETLSNIQVQHQDKILELTGSKLEPVKAFEIIKQHTKGFTQENEKAKQADKLLMELLQRNGISTGRTPQKDNKIKLREQERARALALLELELQLAA